MVSQTLITALSVAQKKDAEARARREAKDDFKERFRMVFGKPTKANEPADVRDEAPAGDSAKSPPDETIWEDDDNAPPERLPDSANVDDAAGNLPPEEPAPKPMPKKPTKRTGAVKSTAKGKGRKK